MFSLLTVRVFALRATFASHVAMPANIPGARRGVRPPRGSRKSNARALATSLTAPLRARARNRATAAAAVSPGTPRPDGRGRRRARRRHPSTKRRVRARVRARASPFTLETHRHERTRGVSDGVSIPSVPRRLRGRCARDASTLRHGAPRARPCPKVALNLGRVRAIWADCPEDTTLVTAIDTDTNHPCPHVLTRARESARRDVSER